MPTTYEPIATTTVGSNGQQITFSSIPSTYTDLRVVLCGTVVNNTATPRMQVNNDTGANYANTYIDGNGTATSSATISSDTRFIIGNNTTGSSSTIPFLITVDIFSYAGSSQKTAISSASDDWNGSGGVNRNVGLWTNTAVISTVYAFASGGFKIGTTATLYGIKAA